jgi:hypothetical protein
MSSFTRNFSYLNKKQIFVILNQISVNNFRAGIAENQC